jgi:hypothetical protein
MIIIDDESSLKKKLDQLKSILTSIHSNSRFDENRKELYQKQQRILADITNALVNPGNQAGVSLDDRINYAV